MMPEKSNGLKFKPWLQVKRVGTTAQLWIISPHLNVWKYVGNISISLKAHWLETLHKWLTLTEYRCDSVANPTKPLYPKSISGAIVVLISSWHTPLESKLLLLTIFITFQVRCKLFMLMKYLCDSVKLGGVLATGHRDCVFGYNLTFFRSFGI